MTLQVVAPAWHVALQLYQGTGLDPGRVSQQHPLEPLRSPIRWEFPTQLRPRDWRELLGPTRWHPRGWYCSGSRAQFRTWFLMGLCVVLWQGHHLCRLSCPFLACTRLAHGWHILVAAALISSMQS